MSADPAAPKIIELVIDDNPPTAPARPRRSRKLVAGVVAAVATLLVIVGAVGYVLTKETLTKLAVGAWQCSNPAQPVVTVIAVVTKSTYVVTVDRGATAGTETASGTWRLTGTRLVIQADLAQPATVSLDHVPRRTDDGSYDLVGGAQERESIHVTIREHGSVVVLGIADQRVTCRKRPDAASS